jgi:Asp-tRNA(Asn)/Glu-tRNA(Gln) amidotransferase A subunit family amidase
VIGKTNQHELAAGVTNLESSCGPTRNPWDPTRITGGSSGGSAVSAATGIVPLSLVSDTGGSARIPAAFCGTWGLKATQGRLSTEGMMPLAPEMDCRLLAGLRFRPGEVVADRPTDGIAPSVVGLLRGGRWERCAFEIRTAIQQVSERFQDTGLEVHDVDGSSLDDVHRVWNRLAWPSFAERYRGLTGDPSLGAGTASLLAWGPAQREPKLNAAARSGSGAGWPRPSIGWIGSPRRRGTSRRRSTPRWTLGDGSTMDVHRGGPSGSPRLPTSRARLTIRSPRRTPAS